MKSEEQAVARTALPAWRVTVHGYLVLPHAVPIIVVMAATSAFAVIAAGGWPGGGPTLRLLGAMLGGQLAIGAVNDLVDAPLDAIVKPGKPIPAGVVSRSGALIVTYGGLIVMTVLSLTFDVASFFLCALGTGTGIAYSVWFKRSIWSWIPYLIALPLLPIWVWQSLASIDRGLFAIYPIGAMAVIAVQIAQSLPDVDADRESNVRTLAVALGFERARLVCWSALLLAAVLASVLAPWFSDRPVLVWIPAVVALGLVAVNAVISAKSSRTGTMACFPLVALGAVALGVGWATALMT